MPALQINMAKVGERRYVPAQRMNEHRNIHPKRGAVYGYILGVRHSPTVREIANAVGLSTGEAHRQIELLEAEGRIERVGPVKRIVVCRGEGA